MNRRDQRLGFVLMDNQYHLLLELAERNLSRAMQWLNLSYSVWFNRRHGRSGHLFQGRFDKTLGLSKQERQTQRAGLSSRPKAAQGRATAFPPRIL